MKIYVSWKSSCTLFCIYCFFFPKLFLLDMSCMLISSKDKIKRHFQEYLNTYWRLNGSSRQINELHKPIFKVQNENNSFLFLANLGGKGTSYYHIAMKLQLAVYLHNINKSTSIYFELYMQHKQYILKGLICLPYLVQMHNVMISCIYSTWIRCRMTQKTIQLVRKHISKCEICSHHHRRVPLKHAPSIS